MTDGILSTIEDWTGARPAMCPWRAFSDPFVRRVLACHAMVESGNLGWYEPEPSNRLAEGVARYHRMQATVAAKRMERERKEREQTQAAERAARELSGGRR